MPAQSDKSRRQGSEHSTHQTRSSTDAMQAEYNGTVTAIHRCHENLMLLRVAPDHPMEGVQGGQFTVLGLGSWEPRIADVQAEPAYEQPQLIKRAYSISCPILDAEGRLTPIDRLPFLEFYIVLIRKAHDLPPALTPRLFALHQGSRLFCGPHAHGRYTLDRVEADQTVVLLATGAGEAPHNAMVTELLSKGHRGKVIASTCARFDRDLAYRDVHRRLERRFANYRYLPLTTREPRNTDPARSDYVGRRYLQDYLQRGDLESDGAFELTPNATHVFLCGSPDMIGAPQHHDPSAARYSTPRGMVELLEKRGFVVDLPHEPGNLHFELYW